VTNDFLSEPVDSVSADMLAGHGLRMALVEMANRAEFSAWLDADAMGFLSALPDDSERERQLVGLADHRRTGVWDDSGAVASIPVGTAASWPADLTVPGRRSVTAWAISAVSVASTHRRRGIARAMLGAELRTANALGVPVAILTVSEATIYSRFGFGPAAFSADWTIDTRKAHWIGPIAGGRVQFISAEQMRDEGFELAKTALLNSPGEIEVGDLHWQERFIGLHAEGDASWKKKRFVRYDNADGRPQGFAIYRPVESPADFTAHTLEVSYLCALTDDAYAGLWQHLLETDLVSQVSADLRSVDEPVAWQISDFRAARKSGEREHLWVRILDVVTALTSRTYAAGGRFVLEIEDPLGFATPRVLVDIDEHGEATVTEFTGAVPDDSAVLAMPVTELGSLYLGGVSAATLARAGRLTELTVGAAEAFDRSFHSSVTPWLSTWF
jgi:predicted acetyltransferase